MEIITIECPKCKGELHIKADTEKLFCMYCRSEVVIREPEPEKQEVVLESVNHEFQAKLAIAKHNEELHSKGQLSFDKVMESYDEVRQIGAHHWEYWHARAKFFAEAGIKKIKDGDAKFRIQNDKKVERKAYDDIVLASKKAFIDLYTMWMDSAIKHAQTNTDELSAEKEKTLKIIKEALGKVTEHNSTSSNPFMPRPQTAAELNELNGCVTLVIIVIAIVVIAMIMM